MTFLFCEAPGVYVPSLIRAAQVVFFWRERYSCLVVRRIPGGVRRPNGADLPLHGYQAGAPGPAPQRCRLGGALGQWTALGSRVVRTDLSFDSTDDPSYFRAMCLQWQV